MYMADGSNGNVEKGMFNLKQLVVSEVTKLPSQLISCW